jgi:DNA-binding MarR family transcriptional regulator
MGDFNETTGKVLDLLSRAKMTVEGIRKKLGCSRSNVTQILVKLRNRGRVECFWEERGEPVEIRRNPPVTRPRRVLVYSITEEGKERLRAIKED